MTRSACHTVIGLVALVVALAAGRPAAAEPEGLPKWFKLDTNLANDWEAVAIVGDTQSVLLRRRDIKGDPQRHVLSLQSSASSAYDVAVSEAARVLEQKHVLTDIRVTNYDGLESRARIAVALAEQDGTSLIFATGSAATAWLWQNYRGGRLPVVSICAKDPVTLGQVESYSEGTGTNFALTSLNLPPSVQMAYAIELMPNLRNLAIIVDSGNVSAVETQAIPIADLARARGIRVLNLTVHTQPSNGVAEELIRLVSAAVQSMRLNDVNFENSLFLITGSTAVFEQMESINAHAARVPVLSMVPETVQTGPASAVLSIGVSFRSNASLAAVYAASILDGRQHPGDLKVGVVTHPDIAINFRRAREIGLRIPFSFFESSDVIFDNDDKLVRTNDASEK